MLSMNSETSLVDIEVEKIVPCFGCVYSSLKGCFDLDLKSFLVWILTELQLIREVRILSYGTAIFLVQVSESPWNERVSLLRDPFKSAPEVLHPIWTAL